MKLWRRVYEERRRVMLPLLVFVIANVVVLGVGVFPLRTAVAGYENDANDAALTLARARKDNRDAAAAKARKEEADVELKKFYADVLPSDEPASVKLVPFWVNQLARDTHVQLESSTAESQQLHESKLWRVSSHLTLRGDYQDIRRFLYALETGQKFVIVEKVELAQQATTLANANGLLEVGLDVATYYVGG